MKILFHSPDPKMSLSDPRGYGIHMTELIRAFKQIGNEVHPVIAAKSSNSAGKSSPKNAIRKALPGRIIETARSVEDILSDFKSYFQVKAAILSLSPDFIYERYSVFHQSGVMLSKKYRVPIILEVNSPISERDLHYGHRRRILARKIEKRVFKAVDVIAVVSNFLREYVLDLGIPNSKIHVIQNAADCSRLNPNINGEHIKRKYGIKDKIVIGFAGGFIKWHGIDSLLSAAHDVIKKIKNVHFLLVGDGQMRSSSEKFVKDNGLSGYVTFTGSVLYKNIPQYIAAMDITLMPCSNLYGSPIKIFEYMAMGKAIVGPKVGPVEEIIRDGEEGLLINPGNKDQLRDAILELSEHDELRNQMAKNARQKVLKNYTWQRNAERIIQLYKQIS